jgi:hypothetical protein
VENDERKNEDREKDKSEFINFVLFSFNKKFSQTKNPFLKKMSEKILKENKGGNFFVRKSKLCLKNTLFFSKLATKAFYVEKSYMMRYLYAYYNSDFMIH